jgi:hypothetical protein
MWVFEPLLTMSTTDIQILHSADATHLYPQAVLPICQGVLNPIHLCQGDEAG